MNNNIEIVTRKFSFWYVFLFFNLWYLIFHKNVYILVLRNNNKDVGYCFFEYKPDLSKWGYGEYLLFLEILNPQAVIHYTFVKSKYRQLGYGTLLRKQLMKLYDRILTGTNNKSSRYIIHMNRKMNFVKLTQHKINSQWFYDRLKNR